MARHRRNPRPDHRRLPRTHRRRHRGRPPVGLQAKRHCRPPLSFNEVALRRKSFLPTSPSNHPAFSHFSPRHAHRSRQRHIRSHHLGICRTKRFCNRHRRRRLRGPRKHARASSKSHPARELRLPHRYRRPHTHHECPPHLVRRHRKTSRLFLP